MGPLGAGGMGEVYRAKDTRLGRTVAIKVLPPHLAARPEAKQRFEREARAISALQHPRICTLHDVGHQDGTDFLVMEHLEGETLAHRLARGQFPPEQVLEIGIQICEGLEAAHRAGVTHRDLKPANIMLTKTGAKLLDFGLAKPLDAAPAANLTALPTLSAAPKPAQPLTAEGTIIGTFQYMSPEQLEGREADARSDIFALGAVLYEMATGKRAFEGKSQASVIAAILEREPPPVSQSQPASPPALDRAVRQCLEKDPDRRWQSAHDVKLELEWIREGSSTSGASAQPAAPGTAWQRAAWVITAICFLAAVAFAAAYFLRTPQPAPTVRSSLLPPGATSFKPFNFAISPDGTRLAFVATNAEGKNILWVRSLSAASPHQLDGTDNAIYPFWSPDNRRIGFFAEQKLKTVDIVSGSVRILCDARSGRGGTWNRNGTIVFAPAISGPLNTIPDTGGIPKAVTSIRASGSEANRWPFFLPDGRHFLYFVDWTNIQDLHQHGIYVGSLDGGAPKLISSELAGSVAFTSGYLLYVRQTSLMAQPFDPDSLETIGPPEVIAEQEVPVDTSFSKSGFSVSETGVLIFQSLADSASQLEWFDAKGNPLGKIPDLGYADPSVSPDGHFLAVSSDDERNGKHYIRVIDLSRGTSTRITDGGMETTPSWSPDGKWVFYNISSRGAGNSDGISRVAADGSSRPQFLLKQQRLGFGSWSHDGQFVMSDFSGGGPSLAVYSASTKRLTELGEQGAEPRFSPDGRWIAYNAREIVVQPFPGPGPRIQISNNGGAQPVWSRDGKHVFYISRDKKLMEADFDPRSGTAGPPHVVFQTRIIAPDYVGTQYDVAPDGRFIINSVPADHSAPLTLLANWTAALKQQ
ncbi:MAG: protein kinase [Acidobacteriota bacterium]|nr:protein kinase [Acidobacteriota bacterium]